MGVTLRHIKSLEWQIKSAVKNDYNDILATVSIKACRNSLGNLLPRLHYSFFGQLNSMKEKDADILDYAFLASSALVGTLAATLYQTLAIVAAAIHDLVGLLFSNEHGILR